MFERLVRKAPGQQFVHPQPLAEDDDLGSRLLEHLVEQRCQFVRLHAEVGRLIEQVRAVAAHSHVLQRDHQPALVGLGKELVAPPLGDDPGDDFSVLLVVSTLLGRHGHEEVLVQTLRAAA